MEYINITSRDVKEETKDKISKALKESWKKRKKGIKTTKKVPPKLRSKGDKKIDNKKSKIKKAKKIKGLVSRSKEKIEKIVREHTSDSTFTLSPKGIILITKLLLKEGIKKGWSQFKESPLLYLAPLIKGDCIELYSNNVFSMVEIPKIKVLISEKSIKEHEHKLLSGKLCRLGPSKSGNTYFISSRKISDKYNLAPMEIAKFFGVREVYINSLGKD